LPPSGEFRVAAGELRTSALPLVVAFSARSAHSSKSTGARVLHHCAWVRIGVSAALPTTTAINSPDLRDAITDDFPPTQLSRRATHNTILCRLSPLLSALSRWNPAFVRQEVRAFFVL